MQALDLAPAGHTTPKLKDRRAVGHQPGPARLTSFLNKLDFPQLRTIAPSFLVQNFVFMTSFSFPS